MKKYKLAFIPLILSSICNANQVGPISCGHDGHDTGNPAVTINYIYNRENSGSASTYPYTWVGYSITAYNSGPWDQQYHFTLKTCIGNICHQYDDRLTAKSLSVKTYNFDSNYTIDVLLPVGIYPTSYELIMTDFDGAIPCRLKATATYIVQ